MIFRIILIAIIIILISRFVLRFVLPLLQITNMTQDRIRQMQQQMNDMQQKQAPGKKNDKVKEGDYIDYEEVK